MYKIQPCDDPYSQLIANSLVREFPVQRPATSAGMIDLISAEIFSTKQQRCGPLPSPESQVSIRDVIRYHMAKEWPIPFLVPWGSEKPDGSGIDLAELWALKTMRCMLSRVAAHYGPGVAFNVRLEDASAPHLFFDNSRAHDNANRYCSEFCALIDILEMDTFVCPMRESDSVTDDEFAKEADRVLPAMEMMLTDPNNVHVIEQMQELGWRGGPIAIETREYYLRQYQKLYPGDQDDGARLHRLARYLSASLARKRLDLTGADPEWKGQYIELAFFANPPGVEAIFGRRIFYRVIPSSIASNHMAPWRAKGYMLIEDENEPSPKLASFNEPQDYNKNTVTMINQGQYVTVQADYIIA